MCVSTARSARHRLLPRRARRALLWPLRRRPVSSRRHCAHTRPVASFPRSRVSERRRALAPRSGARSRSRPAHSLSARGPHLKPRPSPSAHAARRRTRRSAARTQRPRPRLARSLDARAPKSPVRSAARPLCAARARLQRRGIAARARARSGRTAPRAARATLPRQSTRWPRPQSDGCDVLRERERERERSVGEREREGVIDSRILSL